MAYAANNAVSGDTISFARNLSGKTILLTGSFGVGTTNITITAQGVSNLVINAGGNYIANYFAGLILSNLTLEDATIFNDNGGTLTLSNDTITGSTIINGSSSLSVQNSTITNGYGIQNSGMLTVSNSTIEYNTASVSGGGLQNDGTATLTGTTIADNSGTQGGGIYNGNSGTLTLTDSTLAYNTATTGSGGGIYNNGVLNLGNDTIAYNTAARSGGGLYNVVGPDSVTMVDNILAYNVATQNSGSDEGSGTIASASSNLFYNSNDFTVQNSLSSNYTVPANSLLLASSLANNGGPTQTLQIGINSSSPVGAVYLTRIAASQGVGIADTTISVLNAAAIAVTPGDYTIQIGQEDMLVTNVNLTTNTLTVVRGVNGTSAVAHAANAGISLATDQRGAPASSSIGAFAYGTWSVTDSSDSPGSASDVTLPYALANAQSGDEIGFAATLSGATIHLSSPLTLDNNVPIIGNNVTISGMSQGLVGTYYNLPYVASVSPLLQKSNSQWLGNQAPITAAPLVGPLDFPDIADNGFADNVGDPAYLNYGKGSNTNLEARWLGYILIPGSGSTPVPINFSTTSNDGSVLYIDGNLVVNNNQFETTAHQVTALVMLTPGWHSIDVEYYQASGAASLDVQWDPTGGIHFVDIPLAVLAPSANPVQVFDIPAGVSTSISKVTIEQGGGSQGGGIDNAGTLSLTNVTLTGNAAVSGGGIFNSGTLTLSNVTVSGNTASSLGGGIFNDGTLTLTDSTLSGNSANRGGGLLNSGGSGVAMISATTFSHNASPSGAGINNYLGNALTLVDSTVADNVGDGVDNPGNGVVTLTNDTIVYNTGVGVANVTTLQNTIVAGNTPPAKAGLVAEYYNINNTLSQDGPTLISPAASSNVDWLGNQTPAETTTIVGPLDFPNIQTNLTLNGSAPDSTATLVGTSLQLTDGNTNEAHTAWTPTTVPVGNFATTFQWTYGSSPQGDGFTFAVQNAGSTVVGNDGSSLGYSGISGISFAAEFSLDNNTSTFGIGTDGSFSQTVGLTGDGISFHANPQDVFQATLTANGTTLTVSIWDRTQNTTNTPNYSGTFTIPVITTGYVGFTAGTSANSWRRISLIGLIKVELPTSTMAAASPVRPSSIRAPASTTSKHAMWAIS